MAQTVTIGGATVDDLLDLLHTGEGAGELGTAEIAVPNTQANRVAYSYGDEVRISRDGVTEWTGFVAGKPSGDGGLSLTIRARDKRAILHNSEVHRPFYDMDPGAIIREAVQYRTDPRLPTTVFDGSDLANASATTAIFSLANLPSHDLNNYGSDLWFLAWNAGATGSDSVTFTDVGYTPAPPGRVLWVEVRYLINNSGNYFTGELELVDDGGNNYVWDLDIPQGAEFVTRRYPVEEATTDGAELSTNGTLQFRFDIHGELPERRAAVIDYCRIRPFSLDARPQTLTVADVEDAGRTVTRRFDMSLLEVVDQFATEEDAITYVDDSALVFKPSGSNPAPVSLSYTGTRVTDIRVTRDATNIVNQVTVQGAGDLQKTLRSSASIDYYGVSEREKPLIDASIQTEAELIEWGEGFLNENAWNDTDLSFTVADRDYTDVNIGDSLFVEWPPEGITGLWTVASVETDAAGFVTLDLTGSGA